MLLEKGRRQGDLVTDYLFILSIEILLRKINDSEVAPWKPRKGVQQLLEGYTDDLTIVLKLIGNKQDEVHLKKVIEIYKNSKR